MSRSRAIEPSIWYKSIDTPVIKHAIPPDNYMHSSIFAACLCAIAVNAAPAARDHNLEIVKRDGNQLPFFYPESTVQDVAAETRSTFTKMTDEQLATLAKETLASNIGADVASLKVISQFKDSANVSHVYIDHVVNGVVVANHNAAVHINQDQVTSYSASFNLKNKSFTSASDPVVVVSLEDAVKTAEKMLGAPRDQTESSYSYIQLPSGLLAYVHNFQVRDDATDKWFHVSVDCQNGQVVEVIDYYNRASYKAVEFPKMIPTQGFTTAVNPADAVASPKGWNSDGKTSYTDTQGNNVNVYVNAGTYRATSTGDNVFDSTWNAAEAPDSFANKEASATHLFYLINKMHDITYQYGFTEAAGNFQQSNFGKGGAEGDRVNANDLSTAGTNNANFATPPDGQSGQMNMYLFTITTPKRDGSLDSVIPIHEFVHGVSNRLTGGARNGRCLSNGESGGMGEGWSDAIGVYIGMDETRTDKDPVAVGEYVLNTPGKGVRKYSYSTNMKVNPYLFSGIKKSSEVHNVGEIWATMLFEVYWNLVNKLGFSKNWYDAKQTQGNIVAMQLVIGGMMLQPCNPNFTQARDAILNADVNYYGGANKCQIWAAFAKRGLGVDSVQSSHNDGFKLPAECNSSSPTTTTNAPVPTATSTAVPTPIKTKPSKPTRPTKPRPSKPNKAPRHF